MRRPRAQNRRRGPPWKLSLYLLAALLALAVYFCSVSDTAEHHNERHLRQAGWISDIQAIDETSASARLTKEDILVALPSDESHIPLVRASRVWRKGIKTVVAVNDTELAKAFRREGRLWNETWVSYPDDLPARGNYPGDTRAAIVPFLAHKVTGRKYKWLLYGDDDTQWFIDGVLKLLRNFDHNLPYFITDNLWWSSVNGTIGNQPNLEAPRCLPCGFSSTGSWPAGEMQFNAPQGCPCTPQLLCQSDSRGVFDEECNIPLHLVPAFSTRTYSMHGGAGGIMSVALLSAVSLKQVEECIERQGHSTGGDAFITICLWKLGFAHTDPGPWFNDPTMRLFDAAAWLSSADLASKLTEAAEDSCSEQICGELFENMVSSHVHSRKAGSIQKAADAIALLSHAYNAFVNVRNLSAPARVGDATGHRHGSI